LNLPNISRKNNCVSGTFRPTGNIASVATPEHPGRFTSRTRPHRQLSAWLAALIGLLLAAPSVPAQDFPARPITLVVPFAPGGGTDSIARDIARELAEKLGKPVIVDNRGGDGGAIAAAAIAKAPPDGHSLLFVTSTFATHAAADPALKYDILRDFAPVAMIGRGPLMVVTSKNLAIKSLAQLVALARTRPGELNFCSAGPGSINHLAGEMFAQRAALSLTHVPYRGSAPAVVDLLAGRTQLFFATVPTILPYVRDGRVDLVAVTGRARSPLFADVPTVAESGFAFDVSTWWGVVAPAHTPPAVAARLNALIGEAAASTKVRARLVNEGAEPINITPAEFGRVLASELESWRVVVKSAGLKL
jgi:tripartite-type tricarboxylate transporter receptor subunit TctC